MRLSFHGAAGGVTGSCYLLECAGRRVLLECGLVQGGAWAEKLNRASFPVPAERVDAVVLSHAHIDHSGRLPMLVREGFSGPVFTQRATAELCEIMLRDAAHLQEKDAATESRKRARKGLGPVAPLYGLKDAERALRQFRPLDYDQRQEILPGIELCLRDAGHILGSAIIELWLSEPGLQRKLVFSGDLGQADAPILRDPTPVAQADAVLLESTYGDRCHRARADTLQEMGEIFRRAREDGGNILIPAFAVGRTQELLYVMAEHFEAWELEHWRICLDSPMAIQATELYARHFDLHDRASMGVWRRFGHRLESRLEFVRTAQQSRALNRARAGCIIIAGSGMCEGGRIRHHLKNNLWRGNCDVLIVGYQARGTLGRQLVDGNAYVYLWGEAVRVAARIHTVGGFSAHADQAGLLEWYRGFSGAPPVWLVHGEDGPRAALAKALAGNTGARVTLPRAGESLDLRQLVSA